MIDQAILTSATMGSHAACSNLPSHGIMAASEVSLYPVDPPIFAMYVSGSIKWPVCFYFQRGSG